MRRNSRTVLVILIVALILLSLLLVSRNYNDKTLDIETDALAYQVSSFKLSEQTTTTTTIPPTTTTTQPVTTTTTQVEVTIPPTPTTQSIPPKQNNGGVDWYAVAMCESSLGTGAPQWSINTGNGYYGGLQFSHSTWVAYGGRQYSENAHLTSAENQIAIASTMSLSHWPVCGKYG